MASELKLRVKSHWESEVCGSRYTIATDGYFAEVFAQVDQRLYQLDYMRAAFAAFEQARGWDGSPEARAGRWV